MPNFTLNSLFLAALKQLISLGRARPLCRVVNIANRAAATAERLCGTAARLS